MTVTFILFGTSGCHLCEEAEVILANRIQQQELEYVDIAEQEKWQEKYAIKIPVLYHKDSGKELFWPFSAADVDSFVDDFQSS